MSPNPPRARKQPSKAGCVCRLNLSGFRRPDGSSCSDDARDSDGGGSKDVHAFNPLRCRIFRFAVEFFCFPSAKDSSHCTVLLVSVLTTLLQNTMRLPFVCYEAFKTIARTLTDPESPAYLWLLFTLGNTNAALHHLAWGFFCLVLMVGTHTLRGQL